MVILGYRQSLPQRSDSCPAVMPTGEDGTTKNAQSELWHACWYRFAFDK